MQGKNAMQPRRVMGEKVKLLSSCRFTTYHHRFARAAPAPRAKRNDSKNRGRASPVNCHRDHVHLTIHLTRCLRTLRVLWFIVICHCRGDTRPVHLTRCLRTLRARQPLVAARGAREGLWLIRATRPARGSELTLLSKLER